MIIICMIYQNFISVKLKILICRADYLSLFVMYNCLEIQPAVITTFALSDLMALSDGVSLRTNTACR